MSSVYKKDMDLHMLPSWYKELTPEVLKHELEIIQELETVQKEKPMHDIAKSLLRATEHNATFQKVLCNPFYLNITFSLFHSQVKNLPMFGTESEYETYLKNLYVEQKLRKTENPEKAQKWLIWLAKMLDKERKYTFQLTDLQPYQLKHKQMNWAIHTFIGILSVFFIKIILTGNIITVSTVILFIQLASFLSLDYFDSIIPVNRKWSLKNLKNKSNYHYAKYHYDSDLVADFSLFGLVYGFFLSFFNGLPNHLLLKDFVQPGAERLVDRLIMLLNINYNSTQMAEGITGAVIGLVFGTVIGLIVLLGLHLFDLGTVSSPFAKIQSPYKPFLSSIKWNTFTGIVSGIISGFITYLFFYNVQLVWMCASFGIITVFFISSLFRHFVLRLCLWLEGALPLRFVRFLCAMEATGIIERDGGTWRFRHQLLQDWFAAKD